MEYRGIGVSNGKSLGTAVIVGDIETPRLVTKELNKNEEISKIKEAILNLIKEYDAIIANNDSNSDLASLANAYKLMISSPSLNEEIINLIMNENYSAVQAVENVLTDKEEKMANSKSDYAKERANDIRSIKKRIIKKILGINEIDIKSIDYDFILVSKEVTPSMLLAANQKFIKGIVSEIGSKTSHVAILSKNIGIPAVFNIKDVDKLVKDEEIVYIDGNNGLVVTELDVDLISRYRSEIEKYQNIAKSLEEMKDKKAITQDGKIFDVGANTGDTNDLERLKEINSDGVGLFRSEFLYLNRDTPPSEEMQFNTYKSFAEVLKDKPLIIRTIDIGGDKKSSFFDIPKEDNPFLGYRAIRYCLDHKDIFKTQLRAILRASAYGNVMIMYPMISSLEEVRDANAILRETMADLDEESISYNEDIKIGIMVETPALAASADLFIDEVDFLSIGTNDLVQYMMAVDRTNSLVNKLYDAYNPGVIRMIQKTIEVKKDGKFVGMCGEMAADPLYIILLVGFGLDEFSVNINSVLRVKKYISLLNAEECRKIVEHVLTLKTGTKIKSYLEEYARGIFDVYL